MTATPRADAEAFERGQRGASVRFLALAGTTPYAAHNQLVQRGFRCERLPLAAYRTRTGAPLWRTATGVTASREHASSEYVYTHGDGGIVRIFPDRGPSVGFDEMMELPVPFARRSLRKPGNAGVGWDDESAVVSEKGVALPKALRVRDGLRYDPGTRLSSYRLARAVFAEQCIPLRASATQVHPKLPFVDGRGLGGVGITLTPKTSDFFRVVQMIELRAAADRTIERRERNGDRVFFFTGDPSIRGPLFASNRMALAALTVHPGAYVITVDPVGYEASIAALVAFLSALLPLFGDVAVRENVLGLDLTEVFARFPSKVIEAIDPTFAIGLLAAAKA